jgi:hypothetical protein
MHQEILSTRQRIFKANTKRVTEVEGYLFDERANDFSPQDVFCVPPQTQDIVCAETLREISGPFRFIDLSGFPLGFTAGEGD